MAVVSSPRPSTVNHPARKKYVSRVAEKIFIRMVAADNPASEVSIHGRLDRAFEAAELFVSRAWRYHGTE
jgi:hypothetical protein